MKELELYFHIPFCERKCAYCDFLSAPADPPVRISYIKKLQEEIAYYGPQFKEYQVSSIFFGGGTPTILEGYQLAAILETVKKYFHLVADAEITVECNPGTLDINKADIYRECGINRISFGLQSADNTELKMLGRIHTFEQFKESLSIAEKAGFDNINVDIMSALPGQTMESYKRTVEKVLECNVKHISAYSLIVEEGTPLYDRLDTDYPELPDEDTERQMYYYTQDSLASAGYVHYEISNYARPGYECRHNVSYWERTDYLGFGVGAASLFEEIRHTNITDINMYIDKCGGMINAGSCMDNNVTAGNYNRLYEIYDDIQKLSLNDRMEEFMFLGLRKIDGISKAEFEKTFSKNIADVYGKVIQENVLNGLLVDDGDVIKLTDRGVDISNVVMADFLL